MKMGPLCIICTEILGYKAVSATSCGHVYHEECLQKWLVRAGSCPQCRKPVSQTSLIRKLFFNVEDSSDESGRSARSSNAEDIRRLQEWLQTERQLAEDLQKKIGGFSCDQEKELQGMTILQKEIKELRVSLSPRRDESDQSVWRHLGTVNTTLDTLKHREARNTDYFLRRIWRLMAEIKSRTLEAKELERGMQKMRSQVVEQQRLMRMEKKRLSTEVGLVQEQLTELRSEMQNRERQVAELAAENATLTILLAFEKERSRSNRQDPQSNPPEAEELGTVSTFWSWMNHLNLTGFIERVQRFLQSGTSQFLGSDDMTFPSDLDSYRCFIDYNTVQKTALYTTVSVLSYYMATWLGLPPVLVLIATGFATGAMNTNGQN
uniref:RING-type domain-containing protein n=1 Tax=Strigamia maritima TaxID=126957 RepID=T1IXP8_STRMM